MISDEMNPHKELYDGIAEWYVRTFYTDFSDQEWLELFLRVTPPSSIIADIGCGPGQFAHFFRNHGHPTVSIDLSSRMLLTGKRIDPALVPVVGDIAKIPLGEESVGGVLAAYTMEHVVKAHAPEVLSEVARTVVKGGAVALMVKCGHGFYEFHSSLVPGARGYVQLWDLDELSQQLDRAGFDPVFKDRKAPVSPEEFDHERGLVLARKR
jgi:ubiquinone/menaquinone biosynthesis C-methylase UbiE